MSNTIAKKDADYKFSECAKQAIREYYPKGAPGYGAFMLAQQALQAQLIRCHFEDMDNETKARARKTLELLEG